MVRFSISGREVTVFIVPGWIGSILEPRHGGWRDERIISAKAVPIPPANAAAPQAHLKKFLWAQHETAALEKSRRLGPNKNENPDRLSPGGVH
jgi:hypothetical protein